MTEPATEVECHRCEHTWNYTGTLRQATCPSCGIKTPVERGDQETEEATTDE